MTDSLCLLPVMDAALPLPLDTRSLLGGLRMKFDRINARLAGQVDYDDVLAQLVTQIDPIEENWDW